MTLRVGIVGISGFGGGEAMRLLATHPEFTLVYAAGESSAGARLAQRFPGAVMTLGKSLWPGDAVANASYDEVRIYNTALTAAALAQSALLGPNALASAVPEPTSLALLAAGLAALTLTRRRAPERDDRRWNHTKV